MSDRLLSKNKTEAISRGVLLISLGILFFTNTWWPGILLAIWATLAIKQYFSGRIYDLVISSIVLLGLYLISFFDINWSLLLPILFVVGGIYIIFREYFFPGATDEEDKSEEIKDDTDN
jgi:hypothetical protein